MPAILPGSRDNPLPISEAVTNQDSKFTLGAPREGWAEIAATNQFNDPPKPGMEYWIVPIAATYTGDRTGISRVQHHGQGHRFGQPHLRFGVIDLTQLPGTAHLGLIGHHRNHTEPTMVRWLPG